MKNCNSCAWFCHADGRCWAHQFELQDNPIVNHRDWTCAVKDPNFALCMHWTADGLSDEERASLYEDALVTMEVDHV